VNARIRRHGHRQFSQAARRLRLSGARDRNRAMSDPPTLQRIWDNIKRVMGRGALDPLTKELL
jgi:hypothetical protein